MTKSTLSRLCLAASLWILALSNTLLGQESVIRGRVFDESGATVPDAAIRLERGAVVESRLSGADGAYEFRSVRPGSYRLSADRTGFTSLSVTVEVDPGQEIVHDFTLQTAAVSEAVTVYADPPEFLAGESTTSSKLNIALLETPQSISVVTRRTIEDRQMLRLHEAADNAAGVQLAPGYGGIPAGGFVLRGFRPAFTGGNSLRNGFRDYTFLSPRDTQGIERVEFLKGPSSILYGQMEVGGATNTITKRPLPQHRIETGMQFGSWALTRPTIDATGPLNRDQSLLYRVNFAYHGSDSFRDHYRIDSLYVLPSISWRATEKTSFRFETELQHFDYVHDSGPPIAPESLTLPVSRFLGEPDVSDGNNLQLGATIEITHTFSDNWNGRVGLNALLSDSDLHWVSPRGLQDDRRTINRRFVNSIEFTENYAMQNDLYGRFKTGPLEHNFVFGFELSRWQFTYDWNQGSLAPINMFEPVYGARPQGVFLLFAEQLYTNIAGIYLQDQITLHPRVKALVGARGDFVDQRSNDPVSGVRQNDVNAFNIAPRAGIVVNTWGDANAYFSYTTSFFPNLYGRLRDNAPVAPQQGRQFEAGIKQSLMNGRLLATLAAFQIWKQNVLTPDPVDPQFRVQTGEQLSKGAELELTGRITRNWSAIFNYAFTRAFVSKDNSIRVGTLLPAAPRHSGGVMSVWDFDRAALRGVSLGGGVYSASGRPTSLFNPLVLPGYARVDLFVSYRRSNWKLQVNVNNVGNRNYYESTSFNLHPQPSRHVIANVSYTL